ncbi:MAG: L-threonylcarbamoyladenylate synthase [Patescibacteria group bacterium]
MEEIREGIKVLKEGGIVIFPTDTAFGIGCRIDDEKAIERLFEIRKRPKTQATPVLLNSVEMARKYLEKIPKDAEEKLMKKYWPGALTIILRCNIVKVPSLVRGGEATLGVRIPNHPITLGLIRGVGVPLVGPSANFHGERTPYEAGDLNKKLIKLADYVVWGDCTLKQHSTVIDCSEKPWKIIRQGAIKLKLHHLSSST